MAGHQHELGSSGAPSRLSLASARRARSQTTSASKGNDGTVGDVGDVTVGGGDWARRRWRSDLRRLQLHRVKGWRFADRGDRCCPTVEMGQPEAGRGPDWVGGRRRSQVRNRGAHACRRYRPIQHPGRSIADLNGWTGESLAEYRPGIGRCQLVLETWVRPARRVGPGIGPANWTTGASALPEPRLTAVVFIGMRCDDPAAVARAGGERPHGNRMLRCDRQ
jgi:hypothetical protein